MEAKVLKSKSQFKQLEPDWNNIFLQDPCSTPFQSYAWCMAWWQVFCRSFTLKTLFKHLRIVKLESEVGHVQALLPGYLILKRRPEFRPLGYMASDYCLPLVYPGCSKEGVHLLLEKALSVGFGHIHIPDVPQGHIALHDSQITCSIHCNSYIKFLNGDIDAILATTSTKFRSNLRYALRQCDSFSFDVLFSGHSLFRLHLTDLIRLHQMRFEAKGKKSGLNTAFSRFISLFDEHDQHHMSRLLIVKDGERLIGANLCFSFQSKYYFYNAGIDPEYSKYSLGTVMVYKQILNAIEEGCTTFDFLRGNEDYKLRWKPDQTIQHYQIRC